MKIKIFAYGMAREILKKSEFEFELGNNRKVSDIRSELLNKYPDFKLMESIKFAVNDEYQEDDFELGDNDELIIIPPVSGG